jgi:hypothetical protein
MTDRELMQMALDAMEDLHRTGDTQVFDLCHAPELIPALRARLAQPEPEPKDNKLLGIVDLELGAPLTTEERKALIEGSMTCLLEDGAIGKLGVLLHRYEETVRAAAPPQREWQGLTDEDVWELAQKTPDFSETVAAIEAKLKENNT